MHQLQFKNKAYPTIEISKKRITIGRDSTNVVVLEEEQVSALPDPVPRGQQQVNIDAGADGVNRHHRIARRFVVVTPDAEHQESQTTELGVFLGSNDRAQYLRELHGCTRNITSCRRRVCDPAESSCRRPCGGAQ